MCDPITLMMMASAATSGVQMIAAKSEANKAEIRAQSQAQDEYDAAQEQLKGEYAEQQRQIVDTQQKEFEDKSDAIRAANKSLGTLRATETALSDSSLGTILFEEAYGNALNYTRLGKSADNRVSTLESNKQAAKQSYISRTTLAENNLENAAAEASARRKTAGLNFVAQGVSLGVGQINQNATIAAIKGNTP
ncbi:hypothetical protein N9778_00400 [Hyphomicrobiales bacterium]|nr:hypothetical protein [Hyphomicrobiales bacterium]